jgi:CofD-related protein of GAK system
MKDITKNTSTMTRHVVLPDEERLALFKRTPELGPRILFFTGGTALKNLSRKIIDYTHNSIHITTPFDSGGSSAVIREAFAMLAVGDIRNRIMALADKSVRGNPVVFDLFAYRLPKYLDQSELRRELESLISGEHEMVRSISNPMRQIIRSHLRLFYDDMPGDFDLRGACIGNLILTGGFLGNERHIDPVVYTFSKLVEARGDVCAISNRNLHLVSELEDGTVLVGQHLITGKESNPITSPIKNVYIAKNKDRALPTEVTIRNKIRNRILDAHLICYPIGSFYSSVVANLLPKGVGDAVAAIDRPKIYIPNLGRDPEQLGMNLADCVETLLHYLRRSCSRHTEARDLLNFVLIDSRNGDYNGPLQLEKIRALGVEIIDVDLVSEKSRPYLDEKRIIEHLLSFF